VLLIIAALWTPEAARAADNPSAVYGRVVGFGTHEPLVGCTVAVGRASTKTDVYGRFQLAAVPPIYDLIVADADHASISVYRGLHRRDPLVEHRPQYRGEARPHAGALVGVLSGGGPFPLTAGRVNIYFHSPVADGVDSLPAGRTTSTDPRREGPSYGPVAIRWNGPSSIDGELLVLRRPVDPAAKSTIGQPPPSAAPAAPGTWSFARRKVTVASGQARTVNVDLSPVPTFHVALKVIETGGYIRSWRVYYRPPTANSSLIYVAGAPRRGRRDPLAYDVDVPDLHPTGAVLCASAEVHGGISTERCGIGPNATVSLEITPPPAVSAPSDHAVLTPATTFAWGKVERGIYELELEVWKPTPSYPNIRIYTADTSTGWPDLSELGVGFPALKVAFPEGNAAYKCTLGALGPYVSIDEALGPDGLGAIAPSERRQSHGNQIELTAPEPEK
jgi:hypothetical protein